MSAIENDPIIAKLRASVRQGMLDYMREYDTSYEQHHIDRCDTILGDHLDAIEDCPDATAALERVKATVLSLNKLNEECGGGLIETDQREGICALIIRAGSLRGFNGQGEDVTEEWREW